MFVGGGIRYEKKESPTTFIIAAGAEWFNIHPIEMLQGSPYRANSENLPVCVIGELAKVNLFGGNTALHKKVLINQQAYEVVGVVRTPKKETDSSMFSMMGFENVVYVPYPYLRAHVPNGQLHRIMIRTDPEIEPKALVKAVSNALKERLSD